MEMTTTGKPRTKQSIGQIKRINGIDIYYENYKHSTSKKTIILIHGFLSSSFCFRSIIPILNKQYHIISIDLPPFGKSGKSKNFRYSYKNLAETLNQFLDGFSLKDISLVGHSMGGQICLNMAHQRPKRFEKIILLASSGYLKRARRTVIALSYLPYFHLFIKNHLKRSGVKYNLQQVVYDHKKIDDAMIKGYLEPFIQSDDIFKGLTRLLRDREGDLTSEILHTIQIPCLLIWGDQDKIVPLETGKRLQKDLPNSRLTILNNTGHLIPEERPEDTCRFIESFVEHGFNTNQYSAMLE